MQNDSTGTWGRCKYERCYRIIYVYADISIANRYAQHRNHWQLGYGAHRIVGLVQYVSDGRETVLLI